MEGENSYLLALIIPPIFIFNQKQVQKRRFAIISAGEVTQTVRLASPLNGEVTQTIRFASPLNWKVT